MSTLFWLPICSICFSFGFVLGTWLSYRKERKRMLKRAEEEIRRMDEMAESCKKQIAQAYESAAKMVGINLDIGGTKPWTTTSETYKDR